VFASYADMCPDSGRQSVLLLKIDAEQLRTRIKDS